MSWAGDRLEYLTERYTRNEIRNITGIPESTQRYVESGERRLPSQYILNLKSMYTKDIYRRLRESGIPMSQARNLRYTSVERANEYLNESGRVISALANYRLSQYREYLVRNGTYVSDEVTLSILQDKIREAMKRSPIDLGRHEGQDSPSLRHVVVVDEE
jgi:hypothetical protein